MSIILATIGCTKVWPAGAIAVKPRVAIGDCKKDGPAGDGACWVETAGVDPNGKGVATPGDD